MPDDFGRRVGIWCAVLATPVVAAVLIAPPIIQHEWMKDARARVKLLGYVAAEINVQEIPCHGWTDFGYSVDYQAVQGEKPKRGLLCRKFGDDFWTWHPQ